MRGKPRRSRVVKKFGRTDIVFAIRDGKYNPVQTKLLKKYRWTIVEARFSNNDLFDEVRNSIRKAKLLTKNLEPGQNEHRKVLTMYIKHLEDILNVLRAYGGRNMQAGWGTPAS